MDEYPLYPDLPEAGKIEAQKLIDSFKDRLKIAAEEALADMYCDVVVFIESDSWENFRDKIMDGFKNYGNRKLQADYNFKEIRQEIFKDFHDEIIADLNQDMIDEIASLKIQIAHEQENFRAGMTY